MNNKFADRRIQENRLLLEEEKQRLGIVDDYVVLKQWDGKKVDLGPKSYALDFNKLGIGEGPYKIVDYKTVDDQGNHEKPNSVLVTVLNQEGKRHTLSSLYFEKHIPNVHNQLVE